MIVRELHKTVKRAKMVYEHQRLIEFIDAEADKRSLNVSEMAGVLGMSASQLYNLRNGKQPGLQICLDIARSMNLKPDYVLYLAGHIDESELDSPSEIPTEILPTLQRLQQLRGTPFYGTALDLMEAAIDNVIKLFKVAA